MGYSRRGVSPGKDNWAGDGGDSLFLTEVKRQMEVMWVVRT